MCENTQSSMVFSEVDGLEDLYQVGRPQAAVHFGCVLRNLDVVHTQMVRYCEAQQCRRAVLGRDLGTLDTIPKCVHVCVRACVSVSVSAAAAVVVVAQTQCSGARILGLPGHITAQLLQVLWQLRHL